MAKKHTLGLNSIPRLEGYILNEGCGSFLTQ